MTFTRTTVNVTDGLHRYDTDAILNDLVPEDDVEALGVLLRPAFHGETILRYQPVTGTIQISAYAESLWYFLSELKERERTPSSLNTKQRLLEKYRGIRPAAPTIEKWTETESLSTGEATAAALAAAFDEARAERSAGIGVDGMSVFGFRSEGASTSRFEAWSPRPGSKAHRFVLLLYQLADQHLRTDEAERRLEDIHGYLELGLPWKLVSESPLVVRVFGSLSSTQIPALREALDRLPRHEHVIMDLTRLSGMGTLLHPVWRTWLHERSNVIWAEGESARAHLDSIGAAPETRFPDLTSALGRSR